MALALSRSKASTFNYFTNSRGEECVVPLGLVEIRHSQFMHSWARQKLTENVPRHEGSQLRIDPVF